MTTALARKTYKLPGGEVTEDSAKYTLEWQKLFDAVVWATGGKVYAFDPDIAVDIDGVQISFPVAAAKALRLKHIVYTVTMEQLQHERARCEILQALRLKQKEDLQPSIIAKAKYVAKIAAERGNNTGLPALSAMGEEVIKWLEQLEKDYKNV